MGGSTSSVFEAFGSGVKSSFQSVKLPTMNNVKRFGSVLGTTGSSILSKGKEIITSKPAQKVAAAVGTAIIHKEIRSSVSSRPSFLNRITNKFSSKPKKTNNNGNIEMTNISTSTKINESGQPPQQPLLQQQQQQQLSQNAGNKQTPSKKEKTPSKKEKTHSKKETSLSKKEMKPSENKKKSKK